MKLQHWILFITLVIFCNSCDVGCGKDIPVPYGSTLYKICLSDSTSLIYQVETSFEGKRHLANYNGRQCVIWNLAFDKPNTKVIISHTYGVDSFYYNALLKKEANSFCSKELRVELENGLPQLLNSSFSNSFYRSSRIYEQSRYPDEIILYLKK